MTHNCGHEFRVLSHVLVFVVDKTGDFSLIVAAVDLGVEKLADLVKDIGILLLRKLGKIAEIDLEVLEEGVVNGGIDLEALKVDIVVDKTNKSVVLEVCSRHLEW